MKFEPGTLIITSEPISGKTWYLIKERRSIVDPEDDGNVAHYVVDKYVRDQSINSINKRANLPYPPDNIDDRADTYDASVIPPEEDPGNLPRRIARDR